MSGHRTGAEALEMRQTLATEHALAESMERYRSLFSFSPHAAFSLDLEGRFTDANEAAERVSGYSLAELVEKTFADIICTEDVPRAREAFDRAREREPQRLELKVQHKDGHDLELRVTAVPVVVHDEVVGVHGLAEDVTEQNELRRELERTRRSAEDASATKSLFLANMSHEVRTPLASVLGAAEMLGDADLDPGSKALVAIVQRSAAKLHRLVNDILDVSKLEAGKLEVQETVISLQEVAADAITWAGPLAHQEGLAFTWGLDPTLPSRVYGDSMRISQVLTNLIGNALKFTDHGEVRLIVEVASRRGLSVDVRFTVEDSGVGIPEDQLKVLFDSFTQVDSSATRKHGGAGLGLAICQELVSLMDGTISVHSQLGMGSRFSFTLPMEEAPGPEA